MNRIDQAIARAHEVRARPLARAAPYTAMRTFAIGDPQTSSTRFFGALDARGLLGDDGWLRDDVRLISLGDHFDYHVPEREAARVEGVLILAWLAAHAPAQVTIIAGNHDLARVMELIAIDDARFRAAADLARTVYEMPREDRAAGTCTFRAQFPELATTGYAGRDYNAFTVEQRALVQRLLLAGRFDLAVVEHHLGTRVLVTHAGVTKRELRLLGLLVVADAVTIAGALRDGFAAAIAAVADDWRAGTPTPLSLEPLHVAGRDGKEGGGLLYHRPADPERPNADPQWELDAYAPRRFDPRDLPGVTQLVGHTGHSKAWKELARWREPGMNGDRGGLRTLCVTWPDDRVHYLRGIHQPRGASRILWMIDPEMHYVPQAEDVAILALDGVPPREYPILDRGEL